MKKENKKAKILVNNESNGTNIYLIENGNIIGEFFNPSREFNSEIDYFSRVIAGELKHGGINFGDYKLKNGFYWDYDCENVSKGNKADSRTYSRINFAILNEMLGLNHSTLEEKAA